MKVHNKCSMLRNKEESLRISLKTGLMLGSEERKVALNYYHHNMILGVFLL